MQESKSFLVNVRFEYSDKKNIKDFCFENDVSLSEHIREASEWYRKTYEIKPKVEKYWDAFIALAERLP